MPIDTGAGGDFQSEDPRKPFYIPPPPPDSASALGEDEFVIRSYEDWHAHPNSNKFAPNMSDDEYIRIMEHTDRDRPDTAADEVSYDHMFIPKKALTDIIEKDKDKLVQRRCVSVVAQLQTMKGDLTPLVGESSHQILPPKAG